MNIKTATKEQIARNIAWAIHGHPEKIAQLEKVWEITVHLTSDDWARVEIEAYHDHYYRYRIFGVRSSATVTVDPRTNTLRKKGRGEKPWFRDWIDLQISDILRLVADMNEGL